MTAARTGRRMKKYRISAVSRVPGALTRSPPGCGAAPLSATAATGFTGRPGAAFWTPSTTTRSPAARPCSMIQASPLQGPVCTSRRDDRVARAHDQDELPAQRLLHRAPGHGQRAVAGEALEPHAHELARRPAGAPDWRTTARNSWVPVAGSSDGLTKSSLPVRAETRSRPGGPPSPPARCPAGSASALRDPARHRSRSCELGRKVTYTGSSCSIVVSRSEGPVTRAPTSSSVRPTRPRISARTTASSRFFQASSSAAWADSTSARALSTSCCATAFRASSGSSRASVRWALASRARGAPVGGVVAHALEPVQHVARLHDGALGERPRLDDAVDPSAHLDPAHRLHLAYELVGERQRLRGQGDDAHFRRRGCRGLPVRLLAPRERRQRDDQGQPASHCDSPG